MCFFKQLGSGGAPSGPQVFLGFTSVLSTAWNHLQHSFSWLVFAESAEKVGKGRALLKSMKDFLLPWPGDFFFPHNGANWLKTTGNS